ncbi:hypothetical protein HanIR_Chr03g0147591 [Helianthus annuus]|nr:hypothetical protein HanIR_Chr03g0147591 [Helianthus annuus]
MAGLWWCGDERQIHHHYRLYILIFEGSNSNSSNNIISNNIIINKISSAL